MIKGFVIMIVMMLVIVEFKEVMLKEFVCRMVVFVVVCEWD